MKMSGVEEYDIPAFLRKQADWSDVKSNQTVVKYAYLDELSIEVGYKKRNVWN
jgi:hypothetical protein